MGGKARLASLRCARRWARVLVRAGRASHSRLGRLQTISTYRSRVWRLAESTVEAPADAVSGERLLPDRRPSSRGLRARTEELAPWGVLHGAVILITGAVPPDGISSQRPDLHVPSHWALGFNLGVWQGRGWGEEDTRIETMALSPPDSLPGHLNQQQTASGIWKAGESTTSITQIRRNTAVSGKCLSSGAFLAPWFTSNPFIRTLFFFLIFPCLCFFRNLIANPIIGPGTQSVLTWVWGREVAEFLDPIS